MNKHIIHSVVIDDDSMTAEYLGETNNDTQMTELIVKMQGIGMNVRCSTSDEPISGLPDGYREEKGLAERLLDTYKRRNSEN